MHDQRLPKTYMCSAITRTIRARDLHKDNPYPYYNNSVVIEYDDIGGYFLLLSCKLKVENEVLWVNQDEDWVVTYSWPTFAHYLDFQLSQ